MKRTVALFLLLVLLAAPLPVFAAAPPKIVDSASLLTSSEIADLESKAQALADAYEMDVVILTVPTTGGVFIETFADDYFDDNGYGIGEDFSGILLVLAMDTREWAMSTCGDAIKAVTDYCVQSLFGAIAPQLSNNQYYEAFDRYLSELEQYFKAYQNSDPIDGTVGGYDGPGSVIIGTQDPETLTFGDIATRLLIALVIGAAAGGIVILIMRGQMNTARPQSGAKDYMSPGSYNLYRQQDLFLYSRTSRTRKPDSSSSGGSRGGGSSVHRSSSGRSHGGGHGRF